MSSRMPLPSPFDAEPFRVRDAPVRLHRLYASDLNREVYGMRWPTAAELEFEQRCRLFQMRMPDAACFSHATAARLLGIPLPWRLANENALHIAMRDPARAPHAAGIKGHRLRLAEHELMILPNGLRVTSPLRTWFDLGTMLPLLDLVAAGDHLIHWQRPMVDPADVLPALDARKGWRGRRLLLSAAEFLSDRSESPPESKLRVIIVLAGLPAPKVNHTVSDRFGEFVARTDLVIEEYRLVLEYQGDYHRTTKGQWRADMTRRSRIESEDWRVMELNADDLRDPVELIRRIRAFARLPRLGRLPDL